MKRPTKLIALLCAIILHSCINIEAQEKSSGESKTGYVNFNLGESPVSYKGRQKVSLYGCRTKITTEQPLWDKKKNLAWGVDNQVLPGVRYGRQKTKDGKKYYVSKYYMASPPVMELIKSSKSKDSIANIGLVVPDRFTFFGEEPVQMVYLDYRILEPVYLNYVGINYDYVDTLTTDTSKMHSCSNLKVDLVPLNIQCEDFRWQSKSGTTPTPGGKGASGIAGLENKKGQRQVFLPSYKQNSDFLNCEITILDDILPEHEVFFATDTGMVKSISLTEFYKNKSSTEKISLFCKTRNELPAGCKKKKLD